MINRNDWNEMTEVERAEWKTLMASPEFSAMSQMEKILAENKTAAAAHKRNWERGPNAEQIADNERNNRAAKRMVANDAADLWRKVALLQLGETMNEKLDLLDCIAHGTSARDFLAAFDGNVIAAAEHLAAFYLEQLRESTVEVDMPTADEMRVAICDAERALNSPNL